jgi:hypothetical protein
MCFTLRLHTSAAPPRGGLTQALAPMKKILALSALFIAYFCSQTTYACEPIVPDPRNDARTAKAVLIGYVTGEHFPEYEAHLVLKRSPKNAPLGRRLVRVTFTEALKGKLLKPIEIPAPCSAPFPRVHERVIVVHNTDGYQVIPADFPRIESEFRAILRAGR